MKTMKLVILIVTIAVALFLILPNLSWAQDTATVYKTKCAACHGADLGGKPAAKIPSLVSDDAKKLSDADLSDVLTGCEVVSRRLSTDPYRGSGAQHGTEVEPDSFAYGRTIVAAFQVGRYVNGGAASNDTFNYQPSAPDAGIVTRIGSATVTFATTEAVTIDGLGAAAKRVCRD